MCVKIAFVNFCGFYLESSLPSDLGARSSSTTTCFSSLNTKLLATTPLLSNQASIFRVIRGTMQQSLLQEAGKLHHSAPEKN